jgi:5'-nucleotidase
VNVIYSGTVSAATEAAVFGIPSVAMSIDSFKPAEFSAATEFLQRLLKVIEKEGLPEGVSLNVNIPNVPAQDVRGVRITHQGKKKHLERYDRRIDPRGHVYYWLCNSTFTRDTDLEADSLALEANYISVTPIQYDLTRYAMLDTLKQWQL